MLRPLALAAVITVAPLAFAYAADCPAVEDKAGFAELNISRVKAGQQRVNFTKPDCQPTRRQSCAMSAFVVPGDIVLIGPVFDASTCAVFVNTKGQVTTGLLPNDRLEATRPLPARSAAAFPGTWTRTEAKITIKSKGRAGVLSFDGEATYGSLDAQRVKRGAVNMGEFSFDLKPVDNRIDVGLTQASNGDTITVAPDKADKTDCRVAMIALGPYLVVEDNQMCGGANVSFTGVYRRAR